VIRYNSLQKDDYMIVDFSNEVFLSSASE